LLHGFLPFVAATLAAGALFLATGAAFGQTAKVASSTKSWTQSKTPWGDPDIQGTWTSDDCIDTPMNRPANLGDRGFFTEQELSQRESQLQRQHENDLKQTVDEGQR